MFSTDKLLSSGLKYGLSSYLGDDNKAGFNAVQNAARTAGNEIRTAADANAASFNPFVKAGTSATGQLSDLYGLNGADASQRGLADYLNSASYKLLFGGGDPNASVEDRFRTDPGYNFARDQGVKALDASAAKRGMLISGNNQQAVQDFGTSLADRYYKDYIQRLATDYGNYSSGLTNAASSGQNAAAQAANARTTGAQGGSNADYLAAQAYAAMKQAEAERSSRGLADILSSFF